MRRCLVPSDGFYEWKTVAGGKKIPFRITRKDRKLFAFAGLWKEEPTESGKMRRFAIITTAASAQLRVWSHGNRRAHRDRQTISLPLLDTQGTFPSAQCDVATPRAPGTPFLPVLSYRHFIASGCYPVNVQFWRFLAAPASAANPPVIDYPVQRFGLESGQIGWKPRANPLRVAR